MVREFTETKWDRRVCHWCLIMGRVVTGPRTASSLADRLCGCPPPFEKGADDSTRKCLGRSNLQTPRACPSREHRWAQAEEMVSANITVPYIMQKEKSKCNGHALVILPTQPGRVALYYTTLSSWGLSYKHFPKCVNLSFAFSKLTVFVGCIYCKGVRLAYTLLPIRFSNLNSVVVSCRVASCCKCFRN